MHGHWHGLAAIILALGVTISLVLLSVMELVRDGAVTPEEATLLATGFGAAIGAIATYLGGRDD
jgi:hypothetical protein